MRWKKSWNYHENVIPLTWTLCCVSSLMEKQGFFAAYGIITNELHKQMTPPWQIILNTVQGNVRERGAACIMDLPVTPKMTIRADADTEKGKNCDGDLIPTGFVSTSPLWKKDTDRLVLLSSPLNMFGWAEEVKQKHVDLFFLCVSCRALSAKTQTWRNAARCVNSEMAPRGVPSQHKHRHVSD